MAPPPPLLRPVFESCKLADINIGYLTKGDVELMWSMPDNRCSERIMRHVDDQGFLFSVSHNFGLQRDLEEILESLTCSGFSERMAAIFCEARKQGFRYIRFDTEGGEIKNISRSNDNED